MAEQTLPDFVLVDSLRPGLANLNLVLKVVEAKEVLNKKHPDGSSTTIVECVVGDASGTIILTARNRQAETCKPGCTITVRKRQDRHVQGHDAPGGRQVGLHQIIERRGFRGEDGLRSQAPSSTQLVASTDD